MGKKFKKEKKEIKKYKTHIPMVLSVIAIIIAIQSNLISREANKIFLEDTSGKLIVSGESYYGGSFISEINPEATLEAAGEPVVISEGKEDDFLYCTHKIRLSNLGGAASTIVDYQIRVEYEGEVYDYFGYGEATAFSDNRPYENLPITRLQTVITYEELNQPIPIETSWVGSHEKGIPFPLSVEGKISIDLIIYTIVTRKYMDPNVWMVAIIANSDIYKPEDVPDQEDFNKFTLQYYFTLADGTEISSNPLTCLQIHTYEPQFPEETNHP